MPSPVRSGIALLLAAFIVLIQALSASAKPVVLTVAGLGPEAARQLSHEGLEEFTQKTGIQVEFVPAWGNSTDQLALTLRALNEHFPTPDIYMIDVLWPATLASHLLDLSRYVDAVAREQSAELLKNDTVNGRLVALPFYLNVGTLFYRPDLLKKYGYRHPPNTWDEMQQMAARIERGERAAGNRDFWGYVFQGAAYEGLTCNALEWQMSFGGGHIIESDGTVSINNARAAQALRKARGWIGSISPPSVLSYTEADSLNAFRSGNAAFLRYWSSGYNSVANSSALRGRCQMTVLPAGPRGRAQAMGGFQLAVSAYSRHPREAAQLVVYLTGNHVQKCRALQGGYFPTLPRLYDDPELLRNVSAVGVLKTVGLTGWVARPSTIAGSHYAEVSRIYFQGVHAILGTQRPVEDVLASVENQLLAVSPNFHLPRN
jgi:trehalose/maltose transport system substrate-binding protein